VLLPLGIVISALVFLAPIVTGDNDGVLGRVGVISLVALGLASTPVLASGTVGAIWLYGRRLRVGEYVELGAYRGRVAELNLLELRLIVTDRTELRVPHLLTLVRRCGCWAPVHASRSICTFTAGSSVTEVRSLLASVAAEWAPSRASRIVSPTPTRSLSDRCHLRIARSPHAFHIRGARRPVRRGITLGRDAR